MRACALSGSAATISSGWMSRMSGGVRTARFKATCEIHDVKLVLDERPAGFAVLAAPLDIGEVDAVALDQETGAAVGERIDQRRRAGGRVVVELGARPVDVAGVKEARQPVVGAVERAADQGGDVGGAQEAMPRELAHDLHVVIGQAEGRRFRRTAEPRQARLRCDDGGIHTEIIPLPRSGQPLAMRTMGRATDAAGRSCRHGSHHTSNGPSRDAARPPPWGIT